MIEKDGFSTAEYPTGAKFKFSYSQKKGDQNSKSERKARVLVPWQERHTDKQERNKVTVAALGPNKLKANLVETEPKISTETIWTSCGMEKGTTRAKGKNFPSFQ